jgi:predicted RNA-binding Zn-ribbon protein involved in translation (DUF1610 family)
MFLDPKDKGTQAKRNCIQCGGCLGEKDFSCPNCGDNQQAVGQPHTRKVEDRGRQFNPYSNDPHSNPMQYQRGVPLNRAASVQKESEIKDPKEKADPDIVPHVSDEILQCTDPSEMPKRKRRKNVDKHIEEVSKSCLDLAIDG